MICNRCTLIWLATAVGFARAQFGFLEATKEPIPPVEVPKEEIFAKFDMIRNDYGSQADLASEVWKKLPMPADDYPDNLKGVLWMDLYGQFGYENFTSIHPPANESLFTFGDAHFDTLDTKSRMQLVSPGCGGAWTIDPITYGQPAHVVHLSTLCYDETSIFQFAWNEDYTIGSIYQYNTTGDLQNNFGGFAMMRVPDQPEGTCPPAEDATPEERNLCAKFIRVSFGGSNPNGYIYPVFEVVGADGVPREPYYSAYLDGMERKNATMQHWRPLKATMDGGDKDTDEAAPVDAGNHFNISLTGNATDAPAGTTDAPTTADPSSVASTATVTSVLALLLGAAVMMV